MTSSPENPIATDETGQVAQGAQWIMPGLDDSDCSSENLAIDNSSTDESAYVLNCIEGIQAARIEQNRGSDFARSVGC